ncbi:DUF342 domain-containing protein [Anaerobacillus sp. MEB173]|uniref:DUF342 domain-containing protein n=1 Tax=Anaerobacillus sp. MEB173 TaxID=3383345 RepID=UPI003F93D05C
MGKPEDFFKFKFANNRMQAYIIQFKQLASSAKFVLEDFYMLLKENGIQFGLKDELVPMLAKDPQQFSYPLLIAEGKQPVNGKDASIIPIYDSDDKKNEHQKYERVDYKQVHVIPSVTKGQLVAEKLQATEGTPGINVFGEEVLAKKGKDVRFRIGQNTAINEDGTKLFSTIDGQMMMERNGRIHIYPSYDVHGDLTMKTGNISFVGNVNINGNVPTGYQVVAKGDIRIRGTVEAATIISGGSVFVGAGIMGQGKGKIEAKGSLHSTFVNQATVDVEGDIHVSQSIFHSQCTASGSVYCNEGKGNIVGGILSAGGEIIAKNIGNSMHTATSLYLGANKNIIDREKVNRNQLKKAEEDIAKLTILLKKLLEKNTKGNLLPNERIMLLRIRNTVDQATKLQIEAKENLIEIEEQLERNKDAVVKVAGSIYPNVIVIFGKYQRKISTINKNMKITLEDNEIIFTPM